MDFRGKLSLGLIIQAAVFVIAFGILRLMLSGETRAGIDEAIFLASAEAIGFALIALTISSVICVMLVMATKVFDPGDE